MKHCKLCYNRSVCDLGKVFGTTADDCGQYIESDKPFEPLTEEEFYALNPHER